MAVPVRAARKVAALLDRSLGLLDPAQRRTGRQMRLEVKLLRTHAYFALHLCPERDVVAFRFLLQNLADLRDFRSAGELQGAVIRLSEECVQVLTRLSSYS